MRAELLFDLKLELGESPVYDAEKARMIWVDIPNGSVYVFEEKTGKLKKHSVGALLANVVLCRNGGYILAMQDGLYFADDRFEKRTALGAPENYSSDIRFNDGKCDEKGRLFIGTCSYERGAAALYRWTREDGFTQMLSGVSISNGIVWNQNSTKMYYVDTPTKQVCGFDYDLESGTFHNKTIVCDLRGEPGEPDGMCIDSEGMLWIAKWNGAMVSCWNPNTGEKLASVDLPVQNISACAFGGEKLSTLYVTTARFDTNEETLSDRPLSGGIFKIETPVKGAAFNACSYSHQ